MKLGIDWEVYQTQLKKATSPDCVTSVPSQCRALHKENEARTQKLSDTIV